jgi:hypothetical protein
MSTEHYTFNALIPDIEAKNNTLLAKMTLEEKVGQKMQSHIRGSYELPTT